MHPHVDPTHQSLHESMLWSREWVENPGSTIKRLLEFLCNLSGAQYAHIRSISRDGHFYTMVDSIGPYKTIGSYRRFKLIDKLSVESLSYQFVDYTKSTDCSELKNKYDPSSNEYKFIASLKSGFWIPLKYDGHLLGYIILSWNLEINDSSLASTIQRFMESMHDVLPLIYSACRSVITDSCFSRWLAVSGIILSSPTEPLCYEHIAKACLELWGREATIYIGNVDTVNNRFDILSVNGKRDNEPGIDNKRYLPLDQGLLGFAYKSITPIISPSLKDDNRFLYHSMLSDGQPLGSAIACRISNTDYTEVIAVISVEHEIDKYFDYDDRRYINAIARISYEALNAHKTRTQKVARDIDTLFTQVAHDIKEPLQALIADADILKHKVSIIPNNNFPDGIKNALGEIYERAQSILDSGLDLNKQTRFFLEQGLEGASTKVITGRVNIYRLLNTLVDNYESSAASQGVDIRSHFDDLKSIEIFADEVELKSALGHLLGNAIKYSFRGKKLSKGDNSGYKRYINITGHIDLRLIKIGFENFGIGIRKSELNRVKERFFRGEAALSEGRAGTGRGLWSANNFFESLGGGIDITSKEVSSDSSTQDGPYLTKVIAYLPLKSQREE